MRKRWRGRATARWPIPARPSLSPSRISNPGGTEVRALADDTLCPTLQWPGHEGEARPYNLSLGTALDEVPLVAAALDVIALANAPLPMARAAALIRSPHVAGDTDDWLRRVRH